MGYYTAKVQLVDDSTGKQKKVTEMYLVEAMSVTEAEAKVVKDFGSTTLEYEVKAVSSSKIIKIIELIDGNKIFIFINSCSCHYFVWNCKIRSRWLHDFNFCSFNDNSYAIKSSFRNYFTNFDIFRFYCCL